MKTIIISTETSETYSSISNFFIDYYMTEANGEFVKVYLYLVRLLSNNRAVTVAEIADHFNLTENDICRAIKYWTTRDVLKLTYDEKGYPTGIVLLPLSRPDVAVKASSDALSILRKPDITPVSEISASAAPAKVLPAESIQARTESSIPQKRSLDKDVMNSLLRNEDWEDLTYTMETIKGSHLSQTDIASLYYIHYDLGFDTDLIEYLVDYCFGKGKKRMSYIEGVAKNWYEDGIRTRDDAKNQCSITIDLARKVFKALCINRSLPSDPELEYIKTWSKDMGFSDELIIKACEKALLARPNSANFSYVHGIMDSWSKNGVRTLADVERLDREFSERKALDADKKKKNPSKVSDFNSFAQTRMDNEMAQLEELLLKEVNQN
jgi:DnaD/phage-associated family protein